MSKFKRVVVTGSLSYDHIMSMPTSFSDHIMPDKIHILNVSFIMDTFDRGFGGTGGNVAYSLALLGINTTLVATAGRDFGSYKKHLNKLKKLDLTKVKLIKTKLTAQGFVTTDKNDNQIWGFYEGAMKNASEINLKSILHKGDYLTISPNDPTAMINYALSAQKMHIPYLFDPAFNIPHMGKADLRKCIKGADILIGNDYEIELIKRRLSLTTNKLLSLTRMVITTLGKEGSLIQSEKETFKIPAAKPKNESDPTGAGDAYRAGFIAGFVQGQPLQMCAQMGATSSVYTVEKYGTQTHSYNKPEFIRRYQLNFKTNLQL